MAGEARISQFGIEILYLYSSNPTLDTADDLNSWGDAVAIGFVDYLLQLSDDANSLSDAIVAVDQGESSFSDSLPEMGDAVDINFGIYTEGLSKADGDSFSLSDSAQIFFAGADITLELSDNFTLSDSLAKSEDFEIGDDANNLSDDIVVSLIAAREGYDTFQYNWLDSVETLVITSLTVDLGDTITLSDAVSASLLNPVLYATASDSLNSWADAVAGSIKLTEILKDTLNLYDEVKALFASLAQVGDSFTLSDAVEIELATNELSGTGADSLNAWSDLSKLQLAYTLNLSDSLTMSDAVGTDDNRDLDYLRRYLNDL